MPEATPADGDAGAGAAGSCSVAGGVPVPVVPVVLRSTSSAKPADWDSPSTGSAADRTPRQDGGPAGVKRPLVVARTG